MFTNIYKNKTIVVTGHTGFKGSWLVAWLQLLGANVIGIALEPNTDPSHFACLKPQIKSHFLDVRNYKKLAKIIRDAKPELIFHLAAQPLVRESYLHPLYTLETNILGSANILNACRNLDGLKGVVVVTSDKCYENQETDKVYCESDPMGGFDPYSASKGCTELVVACFRNSYFNLAEFDKTHHTLIASARAGNVIGGGDWAKDRLIPDIIRATSASQTLTIRNPNATRPWQHVLECLSGYLCLGQKLLHGEKKYAASWNFAPKLSDQISVIDLVKKMQQFWPRLDYVVKPEKLHEAHSLQLDSFNARKFLNWRPVWDLDKSIEITTKWYRKFYEKNELLTWKDINAYVKDARKQKLGWTG